MSIEKLKYRRINNPSRAVCSELAEKLAEIFIDSPIFRYAFPDGEKRRKALRHIFLASINDARRFGYIDVLEQEKIHGVFIYYPPHNYPVPAMRTLRQMPHYLRPIIISATGVWRLFRLQKYFNAIRPWKPHCHALFLGSSGKARYGAVLIRKSLEVIDSYGWPVYLETQDIRTTKLYSRFGSKILTSQEPIPGGPQTWTMWREPGGNQYQDYCT